MLCYTVEPFSFYWIIPTHIDTIGMKLSSFYMYYMGLPVIYPKRLFSGNEKWCTDVHRRGANLLEETSIGVKYQTYTTSLIFSLVMLPCMRCLMRASTG